jgi:hypothetical protein
VIVQSDTSPVLHFKLAIAGAKETVVVSGTPVEATMDSVTPTTMLNREDIQQTPGADRTNGMQMITDYVPAAYVTHDMLHMNGGHQVEWLIDGVPIPNTNIASNLGPQIDPKDIDYLEVQRGSYDADYGDRTYGIFNVAPRTGFERDRECDLVISAGKFLSNQRPDQLRRTHPAICLLCQLERKSQQLRTSDSDPASGSRCGERLRRIRLVHLQSRFPEPVSRGHFLAAGLLPDPIDPDPNSIGNQISVEVSQLRPARCRASPMATSSFSWVHTFNPNTLLTVSPFYHYNGADYQGGANDYPVISTVNQVANYVGACRNRQQKLLEKRSQAGVYGFFQHQHNYFDNQFTDGTQNFPASSIGVTGGVAEEFINDKFNATRG